MDALNIIKNHVDEGLKVKEAFFATHSPQVREAALRIAVCMAKGGKLLLCGNGGSAADAQHVAAEFVNRFVLERPPLPAIALTTDSSILTSVGNDYSYDEVFYKQVLALGREGDVLIAISTSGSSPNVLRAISGAREKGLFVIGLTGKDGGKMRDTCDILLNVEGTATAHVQETHLVIEHLLCHLVDHYLFKDAGALKEYLE